MLIKRKTKEQNRIEDLKRIEQYCLLDDDFMRFALALPQISVLILTPSPSIWLPKAYTHIFRTLYVSPF